MSTLSPNQTSSSTKASDGEKDFWIFGYGSLIWKPIPPLGGRASYDARLPGHILHYRRRFWQASTDHRGTPARPGRVVTLISDLDWAALHSVSLKEGYPSSLEGEKKEEGGEGKVHGVAYHIPATQAAAVKEYLDIREVDGYSVEYTTFYPFPSVPSSFPHTPNSSSSSSSAPPPPPQIPNVLLYIGLPTNPQFLPPHERTVEAIAEVIRGSEGASGRGVEYLSMLEAGLGELARAAEQEEAGKGKGGKGNGVDGHVAELGRRVRMLVAEEEGGGGVEVMSTV